MKRISAYLTLLFVLLISLNLSAENWFHSVSGNGHVTKEVRGLDGFHGVKASAGVNVYLFQGDEEKVVVETDENLQECLITKIDNGVLKCYVDCSIRHSSKLNVYVNFKQLNQINASSGSDIYGETRIESDFLDIDVSSGADIKIEVNAGTVHCNVSSGADAYITGQAEDFEGDASSGADIKAGDLVVKKCKASSSSAGDIRISVTESIKANASSGGDVIYSGNPKIEHISESSGGDVKRR